MSDISLTSPIKPSDLDRKMRQGLSDIVYRVSAKSVLEGRGQELLLRIYLAGIYHGAVLTEEMINKESKHG